MAQQHEDRDGVRFSWNVWPSSKSDATDIVKLACLYTPLKEIQDLRSITKVPVVCTCCKAVLNPFCEISNENWKCNFCLQSNKITLDNICGFKLNPQVSECDTKSTTVEYTLRGSPISPPIFLLVVDTCIEEEELEALKQTLLMSFYLLPPNAWIGLITYGKIVEVHKVDDVQKEKGKIFFSGNTVFSVVKVRTMLGIGKGGGAAGGGNAPPGQMGQPGMPGMPGQPGPGMPPGSVGPMGGQNVIPSSSFLQPVNKCHSLVVDIIGGLQPDSSPDGGTRPLRATGLALFIAVTLLESTFPNTGARVMLFAGGACSQGPGMVINDDFKQPIRSWHNIHNGSAKYMKKATEHYEELARRACKNGNAIDIYACALDQTGLLEMKSCCNTTGGHLVMGDSFGSSLFKETFQGVFAKDARNEYKMAFNALMEVKTSPGLKVCGTIGPCISMNVKGPNVSETELGIGGTSQWKFCALGTNTTPAVFFEVFNLHGAPIPQKNGFIQFITQYQHSSGQKRVRVTTIARKWADAAANLSHITAGFDQEAAAVLVARLAAFRADSGEDPDSIGWLDRMLISLYRKLGFFTKDDPDSFDIGENFYLFARFIFYLRRSRFFNLSNNTPDEITFYRHMLNREDLTQALIMVQPTLRSYRIEGPSQPVLLDSASMQPKSILLLDTYFEIVIYLGQKIAQRRALGHHNAPEYGTFKQLLQAPIDDAQEILKSRFLKPGNIVTEHGGSQARILLNVVNPSQTDRNVKEYGGGWGPNNSGVLTDEESFQVFLQRIEKMVVSTTGTL